MRDDDPFLDDRPRLASRRHEERPGLVSSYDALVRKGFVWAVAALVVWSIVLVFVVVL